MSPVLKHGAGAFVRGGRPRRALARGGLAVLGALVLIGLVVVSQLGENGVMSWRQLRARQRQASTEVLQLEKENADLQRRIDDLGSDPFTLEKLAREEHNMRRPDEQVLQVLPPAGEAETETDAAADAP